MTEENGEKPAPFDAELEIIKLQGRFRWLVTQLVELQQKDRTLSARISRLRLASIEEEGEEEAPERERERPDVEDMTIEQRALLYSELLDRLRPDSPEP